MTIFAFALVWIHEKPPLIFSSRVETLNSLVERVPGSVWKVQEFDDEQVLSSILLSASSKVHNVAVGTCESKTDNAVFVPYRLALKRKKKKRDLITAMV